MNQQQENVQYSTYSEYKNFDGVYIEITILGRGFMAS